MNGADALLSNRGKPQAPKACVTKLDGEKCCECGAICGVTANPDECGHCLERERDRLKFDVAEREAQLEDARRRIAESFAKKQVERTAPPQRYDEVFFEGIKWLDSLAGEPPPELKGEVEVDPSIWKSSGRGDDLENALKAASENGVTISQVRWDGPRYGEGSFMVEIWKRDNHGRKVVGCAQDESFSIAFCLALKTLNEQLVVQP